MDSPACFSPGTAKFILPQPAGNVPFHRSKGVSLCAAGRCEDVKDGCEFSQGGVIVHRNNRSILLYNAQHQKASYNYILNFIFVKGPTMIEH
jgi:hypothetical protein